MTTQTSSREGEDISGRYPRTVSVGDSQFQLRYMTADDAEAVLAFAGNLPSHDLLFLKRDITQPKVLDAWVKRMEEGTMTTLLAWQGDQLVGSCAVARDERSFSEHVGDLRVLIAAELRDQGLGRTLIQECFLIALSQGLEKLVAHMTVDQRSAIAVFEGMGFTAEALLRDYVRDPQGDTHDIVILAHNVERVQAQMEQYGLDSAF